MFIFKGWSIKMLAISHHRHPHTQAIPLRHLVSWIFSSILVCPFDRSPLFAFDCIYEGMKRRTVSFVGFYPRDSSRNWPSFLVQVCLSDQIFFDYSQFESSSGMIMPLTTFASITDPWFRSMSESSIERLKLFPQTDLCWLRPVLPLFSSRWMQFSIDSRPSNISLWA